MWEEMAAKHNKTVGFLWQTDPDGVTFNPLFNKVAKERGFKVVDPGQFPYGLKDFSSIISKFKKENVEIIAGIMIPPDFSTFWRQAHQQGFKPKMATIGKAILFPRPTSKRSAKASAKDCSARTGGAASIRSSLP